MDHVLLHPSYFPTIAQMAVAANAKEVVFEIQDNYQKQTYRNRAYIAHAQGTLLLNVPVKHTHNGIRKKTSEIQTDTTFPWQSQHWKSLQTAYRTSPYFEFYEDELAPAFQRDAPNLMEHNLHIFNLLCELIGISATVGFSTEYHVEPEQEDFRVLINARKAPHYNFKSYIQVFGAKHGFIPNLSVLDLLFNEGPNTLSYLESQSLVIDPR